MPHENLLSPPAAQVAGDTPAIEQSPPAPDGPHPDGSGSTLQLDLADNREHGRGEPHKKVTSSNRKREHETREPHKKIVSSNKKQMHVPRELHKKIASSDTKDDHEIREPGSEESYSLHRTVTLADGPRTDGSGSTPQLDLADNTVDRNKMIPSSNREHGRGEPYMKITNSNKKQEHVPHEPHKKIASSNKKQEHVPREFHKKIASSDTKDDHEIREPGSGESYSLHRTVTLAGAPEDSKAEENGSATSLLCMHPFSDGPRTDQLGSTPQLDLADNTVDRNQMIPSSNREHGHGEPHKKITSSNKKQEHVPHEPHKKIASSSKKQEHVPRELHKKIASSDTKDDHEIREPGSGESYSLHQTVTLAGASQDSKAEENGSATSLLCMHPFTDGPRTDGSGSTPQLYLADNTVDRNQMIPSSNREHGRGEPHKKITSSNKKQEHVPHEPHKKIAGSNKMREHVPRELHKKIASSDTKDDHEIREPGSGESYSLHRTVTLAGASQDSKAEENGSATSLLCMHPFSDGPRTDGSGSTPQLDLVDNMVDRNQMIPSSNREHGRGEPHKKITSSNKKQEHVPHEPHKKIASSNKKQEHVPRELHKKIASSDRKDDHEIREPGSGESYSLHLTFTLADGPRTDGSGSTPQLYLADNTVDRNQMIPSSNREHGRGELHKKITSSNKKQEHVPHEPHKKIASSNKMREHVPRELHKKIASSDTKDDHEIREPGSGESYSLHRTVTLADGPHPDGSGSTPQLDLTDNTVDRNQMITSSNRKREHETREPHKKIASSNKKQMHVPREPHKKIASSNKKDEHEIHEPESRESYSLHGIVTLAGASEDSS
ncbi:hypothetical protein D1007_44114 [Hordeum vulgare]|nr:hypothetical protein D1007_44114 [Hordeum vulgare]